MMNQIGTCANSHQLYLTKTRLNLLFLKATKEGSLKMDNGKDL